MNTKIKPTVTEADGWSREDAALFAFVAKERIRYLFPRRSSPSARSTLRLQLAALCNAKHLLRSS